MNRLLVAVQKQLRSRLCSTGGRGNTGRITVRHRGALGNRHLYRYINFGSLDNIEGVVLSFQYDPSRTAYLALIYYLSGYCAYIIAPQGLKVGSTLFIGDAPAKLDEVFVIGTRLPLKLLPVGFVVHNIELAPQRGGKLCRSAGTYAVILKKTGDKVLIKLRSN